MNTNSRSSPSLLWLSIAVLLLLLFKSKAFFSFKLGTQLPEISLPATTEQAGDPCGEVKRCIVAYVAPWCPHCEDAIPLINAIAHFSKTRSPVLGFKLVVGRDKASTLAEYSKSFNVPAFLDVDDRFYHLIGSPGIPAWVLLDHNRRVIHRFSGSPVGLPLDELVEWMIFGEFELGPILANRKCMV